MKNSERENVSGMNASRKSDAPFGGSTEAQAAPSSIGHDSTSSADLAARPTAIAKVFATIAGPNRQDEPFRIREDHCRKGNTRWFHKVAAIGGDRVVKRESTHPAHSSMTTYAKSDRPRGRDFPMGRFLVPLIAGALLLGAPRFAGAQDSPTGGIGSSVRTYQIKLFSEDTSFAQPTNQWTYFFRMSPEVKLVGDSYAMLDFEFSPTIRPGEGTISVLLNGKPVASRKIGDAKNRQGQWRVDLPKGMIKEGFNEFRIITRQVSVDGPCKDVDFSSNWVRFNRSSYMYLQRANPGNFPLFTYPFPYLDPLSESVVQSTIVVPGDPKPTHVSEALGVASDWGRYERTRGLAVSIAQGGERMGQNVLIQPSSGWNGSSSRSLGENQGSLSVNPGPGVGAARLSIVGASESGLRAARKTLAYPEMVQQLRSRSVTIANDPPEDTAAPTTRVGSFSLSDLGIPSLRLGGAYKQISTVTIQRPVRCDLGRDSFIKLHFRHSANLNPLRSQLMIAINGIPFSSVRLDPENANGGEVVARIPVNELAKNLWQFDIITYHDLASIDCSKSYDDVAWTTVEGDSSLELSTGALGGRPFLDAFPYLVGRNGLAPSHCAIALPNNPSNAVLSAAGTVSARAAQMNRHSFDWDVNYGGLPESNDSAIAIGYYDEAQRFSSIAGNLLVAPTGNGRFKIDPHLRLVPSALNGGAILQAVRSPWSDAGVLYVLLAADDAALNRFVKFLGDPVKASLLTNEVAVITADGELITLGTVSSNGARQSQTNELNRYNPIMIGIVLVILVGLGVLVYLVFKQFQKTTPTV